MKIGIALSGGGARGIAHLGVLQALEDANMKPSVVSGTSAGAIVGALYAHGYAPREILAALGNARLLRFMRPSLSSKGFLKMDKTRLIFKKFLPNDSFEALKMKLFVAATDIRQGKTVYFSSGELISPLQASASIPILFDPMMINGQLLVDGGVLNNMPVEPLLGHCDLLIGVHTNPLNQQKNIASMKSVLEQVFHLAIHHGVKSRKELCDIFIEPPGLSSFSIYDVSKADEMFEIGYKHTQEALINYHKAKTAAPFMDNFEDS